MGGAVGLLLLLLAAVSFSSRQSRPAFLLGAGIFLLFFLFFSWFPAKDIRFIYPLVPILLVLAANGAVVGIRRVALMQDKNAPAFMAFIVGQ